MSTIWNLSGHPKLSNKGRQYTGYPDDPESGSVACEQLAWRTRASMSSLNRAQQRNADDIHEEGLQLRRVVRLVQMMRYWLQDCQLHAKHQRKALGFRV